VTFDNHSGAAGGNVWPATNNVAWLFALGLLLPAYTITGFDAAAQTAEETIDPRRNVPLGIVRAVLASGLAGWVMLSAVVLAIPNMETAAADGERCFFGIIRTVVTLQPLRAVLYVGLVTAMYLCGLSTLTAASRMMFGFARDGGLPFSRALSRIGTHDTPSVAIWTVAGAAILFAASISYEEIAAVCAIFLYIAYVLPTIMGLLTYHRWSHLAVWHVGRWYRPLAVVCVLGCLGLIVIGMQPPNDIAAWVVAALVVVLLALWFGYMRHHFPGPPQEVFDQLRPAETSVVEKCQGQGAP
jgi:amino acid transporter